VRITLAAKAGRSNDIYDLKIKYMIRDKFYKEIVLTIDKHPRFDSSDFKIKISDSYKTPVYITCTADPRFKMEFDIPTSASQDGSNGKPYYSFSGKVCPGPVSYEETFSVNGQSLIYDKITTWLNCIWEEFTSSPIVRQMEDQQNQIDEIFEKFTDIKDEFFSKEEAEDLKSKLTDLEKKLEAEIEARHLEKKETEAEKAQLKTDIDTLKQTVNTLKKKGWLKSFTTKVFKWTKDSENRKMLKDGYKVIREMLPESVKSALPELGE
jgi:hypothetical protein